MKIYFPFENKFIENLLYKLLFFSWNRLYYKINTFSKKGPIGVFIYTRRRLRRPDTLNV